MITLLASIQPSCTDPLITLYGEEGYIEANKMVIYGWNERFLSLIDHQFSIVYLL